MLPSRVWYNHVPRYDTSFCNTFLKKQQVVVTAYSIVNVEFGIPKSYLARPPSDSFLDDGSAQRALHIAVLHNATFGEKKLLPLPNLGEICQFVCLHLRSLYEILRSSILLPCIGPINKQPDCAVRKIRTEIIMHMFSQQLRIC